MATYSWDIKVLYTKNIAKSGTTYSDVILRVEAELKGTSETIGSINATSSFDLDMDVDGVDSSFTAYSSVTKANVETWIINRMDADILANIKTNLENEISFSEKVNGAVAKGANDSDGNFTASFPWS